MKHPPINGIVLALAVLFTPLGTSATEPDDLWTLKGANTPVGKRWVENAHRRMPKLESLRAKMDALPKDTKRAPTELVCPIMLESAYLAAPMNAGHTVDKDGSETVHMFLNGKDQVFDLVYLYSPAATLIGTRLDHLPPDWHVVMMRAVPQKLVVISDVGCLFTFDVVDPFASEMTGVLPAGAMDPSD